MVSFNHFKEILGGSAWNSWDFLIFYYEWLMDHIEKVVGIEIDWLEHCQRPGA